MHICPSCGQPVPVVRGELEVHPAPRMVFWRGIRRLGLSAQMHDFLDVLVRRTFVSHFAFNMLIGENANPELVKVIICKLRKWLIDEGIEARIVTHRGEGYSLVIKAATGCAIEGDTTVEINKTVLLTGKTDDAVP